MQLERRKKKKFSRESAKEMFALRQFDGRKCSQSESPEAFADLLIVTDCVNTIKRGRSGRGERAQDERHLNLWLESGFMLRRQ